jgi:hypothetical protein
MSNYLFNETAGTTLVSIAGVLEGGGTSGGVAADLQTNGSGQLWNSNDWSTVLVYKTGSNSSSITLPAGTYNQSYYASPVIAVDAANEGYRVLFLNSTGNVYSNVSFRRESAAATDGNIVLATPIDFDAGDVTLYLHKTGSDITLEIHQSGSLVEAVVYTDASPLVREGSGIYIIADAGSPVINSWDDYLVVPNVAPVAGDISYNVEVTAQNNDVIATYVATDSDGSVDNYTITGSVLGINATTGVISLLDNTGITIGDTITATVTATDNEAATDTAVITVNIVDIIRDVTNIDGDDIVQAGQSASITGQGFSLPIISVTLNGYTLVITGTPTATNIDVEIPDKMGTVWGSTDNDLVVVHQAGTITHANVTLSALTGWTQVLLAAPVMTEGSVLEGYSGAIPVSGDFIRYMNISGLSIGIDGQWVWDTLPVGSQNLSRYVVKADGTVGNSESYTFTTESSIRPRTLDLGLWVAGSGGIIRGNDKAGAL